MAIPGTESRWSFSLALNEDGRENRLFLESRPRIVFEARDDNTVIVANPGDTWHSLATNVFSGQSSRPALWWWILCDYNNVQDPTRRIETGREIWIPSSAKVADWFRDPDRVR